MEASEDAIHEECHTVESGTPVNAAPAAPAEDPVATVPKDTGPVLAERNWCSRLCSKICSFIGDCPATAPIHTLGDTWASEPGGIPSQRAFKDCILAGPLTCILAGCTPALLARLAVS
jgi:hypothetical protein